MHFPNRKGTFYGVEIATNSSGFRDREFSTQKPPGKKRVVMLGDSFVLGWGVPFDETMAKVLERELNRDGDRFEVINMGVGNYNTTMETELFKWKGLPLQPDMAILVYFVNDTEPVPRLSRLGYHVRRHSYLLAFGWDRFMKFRARWDKRFNWKDYYAGLYAADAPGLPASRQSLRELAAVCRDHGIKLLIAGYPDLHQLKDYPLSAATDYIRAMASECQAPFADLLPAFLPHDPPSLWVSPEDTHGNSKASRIAAEGIYEAFAPLMTPP